MAGRSASRGRELGAESAARLRADLVAFLARRSEVAADGAPLCTPRPTMTAFVEPPLPVRAPVPRRRLQRRTESTSIRRS